MLMSNHGRVHHGGIRLGNPFFQGKLYYIIDNCINNMHIGRAWVTWPQSCSRPASTHCSSYSIAPTRTGDMRVTCGVTKSNSPDPLALAGNTENVQLFSEGSLMSSAKRAPRLPQSMHPPDLACGGGEPGAAAAHRRDGLSTSPSSSSRLLLTRTRRFARDQVTAACYTCVYVQ